MKVRFTARASAQVAEIEEWWRAERDKAPNAFVDSLDEASQLLSSSPEIGRRFDRSTVPGTRRILLRMTGHFLYYVVDEANEVVVILGVWGGARGGVPDL